LIGAFLAGVVFALAFSLVSSWPSPAASLSLRWYSDAFCLMMRRALRWSVALPTAILRRQSTLVWLRSDHSSGLKNVADGDVEVIGALLDADVLDCCVICSPPWCSRRSCLLDIATARGKKNRVSYRSILFAIVFDVI
jgi:hypothetical protein